MFLVLDCKAVHTFRLSWSGLRTRGHDHRTKSLDEPALTMESPHTRYWEVRRSTPFPNYVPSKFRLSADSSFFSRDLKKKRLFCGISKPKESFIYIYSYLVGKNP